MMETCYPACYSSLNVGAIKPFLRPCACAHSHTLTACTSASRCFQSGLYREPDRLVWWKHGCSRSRTGPRKSIAAIAVNGHDLLPATACGCYFYTLPTYFCCVPVTMMDVHTAGSSVSHFPPQMMQNLLLEEGGLVQVESVNLMVATYSKFQPQSPDFLDITNPKAVLENALRNFACLTTGDVIAINYNEKIYELRVMETKPDKAVSIIECDMNVDFDAPLGYKEPERRSQHPEEPSEEEGDPSSYAEMDLGFRAFTGSGNRLDGKKKGIEPSPAPLDPSDIRRGIPNYEYKIGRISFIRNSRPQPKKTDDEDTMSRFIAFSGEGQSLRKKGRKP
ncbi:ubiquitin recognition factor in ER-associated degradation protein 1 isoform X1 [Anguilla anguilla]|uniref:ubiquitin recognition factor in ER-associated degradation protein 1 isoform X1 n=1 Tax=Anguilla anguilla TaxID=7936 RepID=UPI0015B2E5C1|nr:ubiquitin recognition factor in ER-associated degradation protein 1 isoform X1 [Anguilla anguilla]